MGLPVCLHMEDTGKLEEEHESVIKALLKLDLERPNVNVRLMSQLLLVQVIKAGGRRHGREVRREVRVRHLWIR